MSKAAERQARRVADRQGQDGVDAEVGELEFVVVAVPQDVARLDVAVDDAAAVGREHRLGQACSHPNPPLERRTRKSADLHLFVQAGERSSSGDEFEDDAEDVAVALEPVEDLHDRGVAHALERLDLAAKHRAGDVGAGAVGAEELERDGGVAVAVDRLKNLAVRGVGDDFSGLIATREAADVQGRACCHNTPRFSDPPRNAAGQGPTRQ
nr:hypothetical protein [Nannocystis sp.]